MKKPLIAIFGSNDNGGAYLRVHYAKALIRHGCIPFLVLMNQPEENLQRLIDLADGFLFAGGIDVNPELYNEKIINDTVSIDIERDRTELIALPLIMKTSKPILSICRGIQICNVAFGGTLYQDIPTQIPSDIRHRQAEAGEVDTHLVMITDKASKLYDIMKSEKFAVNSFHHQAIKDVAPCFKITAKSDDGIIEALEHTTHPYFLLVQWHPEYTYDTSVYSSRLFSSFTEAVIKHLQSHDE